MENVFHLPNGYYDETGKIHRKCIIKPLGGIEEELAGELSAASTPYLITQLLVHCVSSIGDIEQVTESIARDLLIEDRQFLLLKIRSMTFGDKVIATINCPNETCKEKIDIDFDISDIAFDYKSRPDHLHTFELSAYALETSGLPADEKTIVIRLPNGGDQESIVSIAEQNEAKAYSTLLHRCIRAIGGSHNPDQKLISQLSSLARREIESKLMEVSQDMELSMATGCPICDIKFTVPFDIQDFFLGELKISRHQLYKEVHYLAYHYHWSEKEIMSMSRNKRRQYIELLSDEIDRINDAVA